jgi:[ribosomal protein S5]-alanine N-acetyltransferase
MSAFPDKTETLRLCMRRPVPDDAEAIFQAYAQDAQVCRYMIWTPHTSIETTKRYVEERINAWVAATAYTYVLTDKATGRLLGALEGRPRGHLLNIGYVLAREHWGKGLMAEAIQALVKAAFDRGLFRVEASLDAENTQSARVLEKSGFVKEGRLSRYTIHPNLSPEPRDCFLYAICR